MAAPSRLQPENDKNPVIALREIAERTIAPDDMKETLINSIQKNTEVDEPEAVAAPCCRLIAACRSLAATTPQATARSM